jgi:uncharacterized membrane protein YhaH (DUF805 family)
VNTRGDTPLSSASYRAFFLRRIGPFAVLTGFIFAVLYRFAILGKVLYWGDISLYFLPLESYIRRHLIMGSIPLWNPYVSCGQPLVGNPQSWVYYPTTILLRYMPASVYLNVNTTIHLLLAALGSYLFLRRICNDRLGAIVGAMVYSGSGFVVSKAQFPPMLQSEAWLPWLMILVDRMIDRPRVWYASLLALVVALELYAAHAQIAYMSFACAAIYAIARIWQIRKHQQRALTAFRDMGLSLFLGIIASSVQLLPAFQLFRLSARGDMGWYSANRFLIWPEQLINFILPGYFGNPVHGTYWAAGNVWEPCIYIGIFPLILSGIAIYRSGRRLAVRFFAALGGVALWLGLGKFGGLFWIAFYAVPGISNFHDPARFAFLTIFSLAALSAIGMRRLRDTGYSNILRLSIVLICGLNLIWYSSQLTPAVSHVGLEHAPASLALMPPQGIGRVFSISHDQVWQRYINYDDYGPQTTRFIDELTDTMTPNISMRYGVEEANGYEPVSLEACSEMAVITQSAILRQSPSASSLMGLMNVHAVILPAGQRYSGRSVVQEPAEGLAFFRVKNPSPRAWLVHQTRRIDSHYRRMNIMMSPDFDSRRFAVVQGNDGLGDIPGFFHHESAAELIHDMQAVHLISEVSSEDIRGYADAGSNPALLVWSSAYYPGWQGYVDGKKETLIRTDHAYTGMLLPPGKHIIRFNYAPFLIRFSLYLSLIGIYIISIGLGYGLLARRRFSSAEPLARR